MSTIPTVSTVSTRISRVCWCVSCWGGKILVVVLDWLVAMAVVSSVVLVLHLSAPLIHICSIWGHGLLLWFCRPFKELAMWRGTRRCRQILLLVRFFNCYICNWLILWFGKSYLSGLVMASFCGLKFLSIWGFRSSLWGVLSLGGGLVSSFLR